MSIPWLQLLASGDFLPDLYTLVGRRRFDPDRETLRRLVDEAAEQLCAGSHHADDVTRSRAARWQNELVNYAAIVRDPQRFRALEQSLISDLSKQYAETAGPDPRRWNTVALEQWLRSIQHVFPARIPEISVAIVNTASSGSAATTPTNTASAASQSAATQDNTVPSGSGLSDNRRIGWGDIAARVRPDLGDSVDLRAEVRSKTARASASASAESHSISLTAPTPDVRPPKTPPQNPPSPNPPAPNTATSEPRRLIPAGMSEGARAAWIMGGILFALGVPAIVGVLLFADIGNDTPAGNETPPAESPEAVASASSPTPHSGSAATPPGNTPPQSSPPTPSPPPLPAPPAPTPPAPSGSAATTQGNTAPTPPKNTASMVLTHPGAVVALAWNRQGDKLATGDAQGNLKFWDIATGKVVKDFPGLHSGRITALAYSGDDRWLATTSEDARVQLIRLPDYTPHSLAWTAGSAVECTAAVWRAGSPPQLYVGDASGGITACKISDGGMWQPQLRPSSLIGGIRHLGNNHSTVNFRLAVSYVEGGVSVVDPDAMAPEFLFLTIEHSIWETASSTSSSGLRARTTLVPLAMERIHQAAFNDQASQLAIACGDVEVWEMASKAAATRVRLFCGSAGLDGYRCVDWSSQRRFLAAGDAKGRLNVWEMPSGKQFAQFLHPQAVTAAAWSPTASDRLATACDDGNVRIWTIPTSAEAGPFNDVEAIAKMAAKFIEDDDADGMYRAVCLLQTQALTSTQRTQLEDLRAKLRQEASKRMTELNSKRPPTIGSSPRGSNPKPSTHEVTDARDTAIELLNVIDWDPGGKNGTDARRLLEQQMPKIILGASTSP